MVIAAALPTSPESDATIGAAGDYLATEAHYLSVAGRIEAALSGGANLVLVTGDPPPSSHLLSRAIRKTAEVRRAVIGISCGPELTRDQLIRTGGGVATIPAGGGARALLERTEPAGPLFVFDDVDRLSAAQIREICDVTRQDARTGAAGVLLARPGFLARLEEPALQFLKEAVVGRFCFDEIGQEEGIGFLRHQLAIRQRSEPRGIWPHVVKSLTAVAALLTAGVGGYLLLHHISLIGELPAGPFTGSLSDPEISAPQATPEPVGATPEARPTETGLISPRPTPPNPTPTPQEVEPSQTAPPQIAPAPVRNPAPMEAASVASSPPQEPPEQRLSQPEIAALVARGDGFLSVGDITSARLFYERAADAGEGSAALRLGATFDPEFLGRGGIRGVAGDPAQAASWYRRARDLGEPAAAERLRSLDLPPAPDLRSAPR